MTLKRLSKEATADTIQAASQTWLSIKYKRISSVVVRTITLTGITRCKTILPDQILVSEALQPRTLLPVQIHANLDHNRNNKLTTINNSLRQLQQLSEFRYLVAQLETVKILIYNAKQ